MEDSKSLDHQDEFPDKNNNKDALEIKNKGPESIENNNNELNQHKNQIINLTANNIHNENNKILEENKNKQLTPKLNAISDKNKIESSSNEIVKEKTTEDRKSSLEESNSVSATNESAENVYMINNEKKSEENKKANLTNKTTTNIDKGINNREQSNNELTKEKTTEDTKLPNLDSATNNSALNVDKRDKENKSEESKKAILKVKSKENIDKNNTKEISTTIPAKAKAKPVKEPPIEKKPFEEFIKSHLIPSLTQEFTQRGLEIENINLKNTFRPIAGDKCWVIYCEIKDICNFWLSFEKEDISSLKSISLSKPNQSPSIIESFLIDEKRITLKLIISRILQRLNGQKLIGEN